MKLESSEKNLFDQMPGANGCKDINSKFIYANKEYGSIIGLKHHEDVIGKTDYDMPCDTVNFAEMFIEQDKKVNKLMVGSQWGMISSICSPNFGRKLVELVIFPCSSPKLPQL